ncbi:hypothetical protein HYU50_01600 [Candidatus Woesearchaeota archaeon]|nr:hypothetical protein [Candidatus Woesearchaeota archaeon]
MSKIGRIARKTDAGLIRSLKIIKTDEEYIKTLYSYIVDDIIDIGKKAVNDKAANIISDLKRFADELKELKNITHNKKVKDDLDKLIVEIERFNATYLEGVKSGSLQNLREKITQFIVFFKRALNETILKDLEEEAKMLDAVERLLRKAA